VYCDLHCISSVSLIRKRQFYYSSKMLLLMVGYFVLVELFTMEYGYMAYALAVHVIYLLLLFSIPISVIKPLFMDTMIHISFLNEFPIGLLASSSLDK